MNPLGLLAGLGGLNALSGGELGAMFGGKAATGKRFTGLLDMLDGGGAGASGDKFEGGGLLSILGNLFAKPLEAQNNVERISRDTNANKVVTEVLKQAITPQQRSSAAMTEMNRQRGLLADQFDPRNMQGATDFRPPNSPVTPDLYGIGSAGEYGGLMSPANMPRPSATTAALSPTGDMSSGVAPVPPMSNQLSPMAPATPTMPSPSGMSPTGPSMQQGIMSFREFVDAERAAMSGADLYVDPANYRRGYARYLSSMGINPAAMGM